MTQTFGLDFTLLQQVLHVMPDAAIGCDADGTIVSSNSEADRLAQATNGNFQGVALARFLPNVSEWLENATFLEVVRAGVLDAEQEMVTGKGAQRVVWTSSRLLVQEDSKEHFVVVTLRDVTARAASESRLRELSLTDELTGLRNRRYLDSVLDFEEERALRYGFRLVCAFVDLDRFKEVNDTYGHYVGDQAIVAIAKALEERCRKIDTLARWGGDEFIIIMLVKEVDDVGVILRRLAEGVGGTAIEVAGHSLRVSISIGAIVSGRNQPINARRLIEDADRLLLQAKASGRDRVVVEVLPDA